jgi:hypothetical protein
MWPQEISKSLRKSEAESGGPGWNRTTTYGFGDHRPIHWTTGPLQMRRLAARAEVLPGPCRVGKEKETHSAENSAY